GLGDTLEGEDGLVWLKRSTDLEVGPATGRFSEMLPNHGFEYYGIEISKKMARYAANRRNDRLGHVVQGDGEYLPFKPSSFENVLSVRSFHFLPDPDRFVRESFDALVPGGRLVASFEILVYLSTLLQALHIMPKPCPSR